MYNDSSSNINNNLKKQRGNLKLLGRCTSRPNGHKKRTIMYKARLKSRGNSAEGQQPRTRMPWHPLAQRNVQISRAGACTIVRVVVDLAHDHTLPSNVHLLLQSAPLLVSSPNIAAFLAPAIMYPVASPLF